ncbi:MAG: hypothetical protein AAFQ32_00520 [Pseudomonadota bacterium]
MAFVTENTVRLALSNLSTILENAVFSGVSAGLTAGINIDDLGIDLGEVGANPLLGFGKVDGNGLTLSNLLEGGRDNVISAGLSSAVYGTDFSYHLSIRRQGFWNRWRCNLREGLARLFGLIMGLICGEASAAFRLSFV